MYTQCPECKSIFEISATDLAVAGGFVRCGECAVSFDALNSLSDNNEAMKPQAEPSGAETVPEPVKPGKQPGEIAAATDETTGPGEAKSPSWEAEPDSPHLEHEFGATAHEQHAYADSESGETTGPSDSETPTSDAEADSPHLENEFDATAHEQHAYADSKSGETTGPEPDAEKPDSDADAEHLEEYAAETGSGTDTANDSEVLSADAGPSQDTHDPENDDEIFRFDAGSPATTQPEDVDDVDEILLDDAYEPPLADDDEEFYDDDDDDTLVAAASDFGILVDDEELNRTEKADESALFTLPLPELTALEHTEHGMLPEKLEGGEAAHDPSAQAQTPAEPEPPAASAASTAPVATSPLPQANDAYDAEDARDLKDYLSAPENRATRAAWIGGTVLMALLLVGQVIHRYRGDLVIHPRFGPVVQSLYKVVGADLRPNWQINEYKVVGQARLFLMPLDDDENADDAAKAPEAENTGDSDSTAIRFVAIITNGAKLPQPAPLVRLTLRDRWGDPTGARAFTPPEYLADRTMIGELLEPGQRLRVVLNLYDFGADAVGFDFDMCLPDDRGILRCAHDG